MTTATGSWVVTARLVHEEWAEMVGPEVMSTHAEATDEILDHWKDAGLDVDDPKTRAGLIAGLAYAASSAFGADQGDKTPWAVLSQVCSVITQVNERPLP